jgi:hypothetical protein
MMRHGYILSSSPALRAASLLPSIRVCVLYGKSLSNSLNAMSNIPQRHALGCEISHYEIKRAAYTEHKDKKP